MLSDAPGNLLHQHRLPRCRNRYLAVRSYWEEHLILIIIVHDLDGLFHLMLDVEQAVARL